MPTADIPISTTEKNDGVLSEVEFRRFWALMAEGKVPFDTTPMASTVTLSRIYEGQWIDGESIGEGKLDIFSDDFSVELSGTFEPGFQPVQVNLVSFGSKGRFLRVDGLTERDGRWQSTNGASGADASCKWSLGKRGRIKFSEGSNLEIGVDLLFDAEVYGIVTIKLDTGEVIRGEM